MNIFGKKSIYLDYAGSTPLDKSVARAMHESESELFANPSAIHKYGVNSHKAIESSRANIARLINAHPDEIVFTSSGTESIVLALWGVLKNYRKQNNGALPHIVTTNIEHHAVLANCKALVELGGAEVTYVECDEKGMVNPKDVAIAIKENTVLVSVMYANNEVGTIEPLQEIAKVIRHHRKEKNSPYPFFHTDACQAMNYLMTENIEKLGVDLMSFNSSKIYGPKGVGVLYKKRSVTLQPIYSGGGQEFGLRSGTENTVSIMGASLALEIACNMKDKESARLSALRDYGIEQILTLTDYKIILNGDKENRLPNNINISVFGISSELLVIELDAKGIMVSEKSACSSKDESQSHVINAIHNKAGIKSDSVSGSIRISLGRHTTKKDMDILMKSLKDIFSKYKSFK